MFSAETLRGAAEHWRAILARVPFAQTLDQRIQTIESADLRDALRILYASSPLSDWGNYDFSIFLNTAAHAVFLKAQSALPESMFVQYVLPLRVNEEALSDCRAFFYAQLAPRIQGLSPERAALEINYWCAENMTYRSTDTRTISALGAYRSAFGRCGEESTLLVNALRACGFAARQIYTPRWAHCDDNHAWVEVCIGGAWRFMGACEPEEVLDRAWFNSAAGRAMLIHSRVFTAKEDLNTESRVNLNAGGEFGAKLSATLNADGEFSARSAGDLRADGEVGARSAGNSRADGEFSVRSADDSCADGECCARAAGGLRADGEFAAHSAASLCADSEFAAHSAASLRADGEFSARSAGGLCADGEFAAHSAASLRADSEFAAHSAASLCADSEFSARSAGDSRADGEVGARSAGDLRADGEFGARSADDLRANGEFSARAAASLRADDEFSARSAGDSRADGEFGARSAASLRADGEVGARSAASLRADGEFSVNAAADWGVQDASSANFISRLGAVDYLNQTARYAPTVRLNVRVVDAQARPVSGAETAFGILNMGEIFPAARTFTDSNGETHLDCGRGSLFIRVRREKRSREFLIDTRETREVTLILPEEGQFQEIARISPEEDSPAESKAHDESVCASFCGNGSRGDVFAASHNQEKRAACASAEVGVSSGWQDFSLHAPVGDGIHMPQPAAEQRDRCAARNAAANRLRAARVQAMFDSERAEALIRARGYASSILELLKKSRGNFDVLLEFLSAAPDPTRAQSLLETLSEKDLRDVSIEVLNDALGVPNQAAQFSEAQPSSRAAGFDALNNSLRIHDLPAQFSGTQASSRAASIDSLNDAPHIADQAVQFNAPNDALGVSNQTAIQAPESLSADEIFSRYVLCPRVANEPLFPIRARIHERFSAAEMREMAQNPARIRAFIRENIAFAPELEYDALITAPAAALNTGFASPRSQDILFVAICRALGVPARLNPIDAQPEFLANGVFQPERPRTASIALQSAVNPKYFEDYTIARLERGRYISLDLTSVPIGTAFPAEAGDYRVLTANRLPNGDVHMSALTFSLAAGEQKCVSLHFFSASVSEMLGDFPVSDFSLSGGALSAITSGGAILMRLDPGAEPTEHLLGELLAQADAFDSLNPMFILTGAARENELLNRVLRRFPNAPVLSGGADSDWAMLAREVFVDPEKLPLAIVFDRTLHAVYAASGYNVGLANMLCRIANFA